MMKLTAWCLITFCFTVFCLCRAADAQQSWWNSLTRLCSWPNCVATTCCDDYCPKPLPCATGVRCCECPDYSPKCLPSACTAACTRCNDYCRKPYPVVICPCPDNRCRETSPRSASPLLRDR